MNNISDKITKYVHVNPQIFSFTMLGLSTMMLVYFVAHNDENTEQPENVSKEAVVEKAVAEEEPKEEEVTPQQGGSKRRKNKSKKTKRRHR
jgi:hypothetical protein